MRCLYSKTAIRRNRRLTLFVFDSDCPDRVRSSYLFHAGFIELLVVFKPGSAEDQSRGRSHERTQPFSPGLSAPDKRKATHSPPWLFKGRPGRAREHPDPRTHPFPL